MKRGVIKYFLVLVLMQSCLIKKKDFTIIHEPLLSANRFDLDISGIYGHPDSFSYVFYANGLVKTLADNQISEENNRVKLIYDYKPKESWGYYKIKYDSIIIQRFNRHSEEIYKRWIIEDKGIILNDSTIRILSTHSYWANRDGEGDTFQRPLLMELKK